MDPAQPFPAAGLRISEELYQQILRHLAASAPYEGVGLLAVAPYASGAMALATRFYPGTNVDTSTTRYTMAPAEVIAAFHDIDAHGWWLGAIIHSHPRSAPLPSPTDSREAYYPHALCVIVSLAVESPAGRAWQMDAVAGHREVPLMIERDQLALGRTAGNVTERARPGTDRGLRGTGSRRREDERDGGH